MRFTSTTFLCSLLSLSCQAENVAVTIPMFKSAGIELVQVYINGTGPYAFVLDTGANITMVKRRLLDKLNAPFAGRVTLVGSVGESVHDRTELGSVSVGGLSVEHVEANTLDGSELGTLENVAQGVLGENFLQNFDLLIDNERQMLQLDRTVSLADSVHGEQLQITHPDNLSAPPDADRLVIRLALPRFYKRQMGFLLDSGASVLLLYPSRHDLLKVTRKSQRAALHSLSTDESCGIDRTVLRIGSRSYREVLLAVCQRVTRDLTDTDGLLPTGIFHRVLICHRRGYIIVNPQEADSQVRRFISSTVTARAGPS